MNLRDISVARVLRPLLYISSPQESSKEVSAYTKSRLRSKRGRDISIISERTVNAILLHAGHSERCPQWHRTTKDI